MRHQPKETMITKASGERLAFSAKKLKDSLLRSGAPPGIIDDIIIQITSRLYDGIPTAKIYSMAFQLLKQQKKGPAAKYKLKNALMELGPTGFPFEQFIARIFRKMGFATSTGKVLEGKCVRHEVDVVAQKDHEQYLVECKFHQQRGIYCDVKIPLYISARFNDIEQVLSGKVKNKTLTFQGWVVTNTHFTKDAIAFGMCAGLNLLGWDFPVRDNLKELIDRYGLHPLTCLTTLTQQEKQEFLQRNMVLCSELMEHEAILENKFSAERVEKIKAECAHLAS
ncbi:restriction endonuclease [Taibaiella helva]|uniref:restriction endonuclease n=1 Tax=Taibaiella helva TaxID=2301235 RepID=UPI000E56C9AB|nr:restriction endonuclease [Taibaiella helva]